MNSPMEDITRAVKAVADFKCAEAEEEANIAWASALGKRAAAKAAALAEARQNLEKILANAARVDS